MLCYLNMRWSITQTYTPPFKHMRLRHSSVWCSSFRRMMLHLSNIWCSILEMWCWSATHDVRLTPTDNNDFWFVVSGMGPTYLPTPVWWVTNQLAHFICPQVMMTAGLLGNASLFFLMISYVLVCDPCTALYFHLALTNEIGWKVF